MEKTAARVRVQGSKKEAKFVIFFNEKEGTSALVRLLDNMQDVSVVHQEDSSGWEPFDRHHCGLMRLQDLERCLRMIFSHGDLDLASLNYVYMKTGTKPLVIDPVAPVRGFKMRFTPPKPYPDGARMLMRLPLIRRILRRQQRRRFREMMFGLLAEFNVVVFVVVRRDALRWSLSKYHGDGSGKKGHMQFSLATGNIRRDDIGKISVDLARLGEVLAECERSYAAKRKLLDDLRSRGISAFPLLYEDFLGDKQAYFSEFFDAMGHKISSESVRSALAKGAHFQKVHSDNISDFVLNHDEVLSRFGDRQNAW